VAGGVNADPKNHEGVNDMRIVRDGGRRGRKG
jgi:hypothetical protein